jgi:hypothetical protein
LDGVHKDGACGDRRGGRTVTSRPEFGRGASRRPGRADHDELRRWCDRADLGVGRCGRLLDRGGGLAEVVAAAEHDDDVSVRLRVGCYYLS